MNKLLKFFIPKATSLVLKFFLVAIAAGAAINLSPLNDEGKQGITYIIICAVFPFGAYFNHVAYMPASLDWILLTPTKKAQIVISHGLINLFKVLMSLILILFFLYIYNQDGVQKFLSTLFDRSQGRNSFNRISVQETVAIMGIVSLVSVFIFGILPNYVHNLQQRQNYQIKRTVKENLKKFSTTALFSLVILFFVFEDQGPASFLPWFLKISFIFVFIIFGAIYSTLTSLRYYFSKKKFYAASGAALVLVSSFFFFYATRDVLSDNLHVKDKIESLAFIGVYGQSLDQEIKEDLLASDVSLSQLTAHNLKDFFNSKEREAIFLNVSNRWAKVCEEQSNFTCRLAYYMQNIILKGSASVNIVRKACPNDLGSCYVIYDHKDIPAEEQTKALEFLNLRCKDNQNEFEQNICHHFRSKEKKKKK